MYVYNYNYKYNYYINIYLYMTEYVKRGLDTKLVDVLHKMVEK